MNRKMLFGYNFGKLSISIIPATQAKAEKQDWVEIDVATLHPDVQEAYRAYKDAYAEAKRIREGFEARMRSEAGIVTTATAPAPAAKRQSLADYLATRR